MAGAPSERPYMFITLSWAASALPVMEHAYWGEEYSQAEAAEQLREAGASWEEIDDEAKLLERVTERLCAGRCDWLASGPVRMGPAFSGSSLNPGQSDQRRDERDR